MTSSKISKWPDRAANWYGGLILGCRLQKWRFRMIKSGWGERVVLAASNISKCFRAEYWYGDKYEITNM